MDWIYLDSFLFTNGKQPKSKFTSPEKWLDHTLTEHHYHISFEKKMKCHQHVYTLLLYDFWEREKGRRE